MSIYPWPPLCPSYPAYPSWPYGDPSSYPWSGVTIVNPSIEAYNERIQELEVENARLRKQCKRLKRRLYLKASQTTHLP